MTLPQKIPGFILHTLIMLPAVARNMVCHFQLQLCMSSELTAHTNQTKIGGNVINQLVESGCTIHSPNMRGDPLIVPDSATPAETTNFFFQKITWECEI